MRSCGKGLDGYVHTLQAPTGRSWSSENLTVVVRHGFVDIFWGWKDCCYESSGSWSGGGSGIEINEHCSPLVTLTSNYSSFHPTGAEIEDVNDAVCTERDWVCEPCGSGTYKNHVG